MATTGVYDMTDTWNNGATTFTAIKMDVTDTSSAAASKLIDMQVGSASKFEVGKDGATTITSAAADAVAVGLNGATNPVFQVNAATASVATGMLVTGAAAAAGVAVAAISSGTNENMTIDAKGSGTVTINGTATGGIALSRATTITGNAAVTGTHTVTSTSAAALSVGANGATNPVLSVDANTASVATGVKVTGAAAAAGVAVAAISSGTNEAMTIDAKGSGTLTLNGTATGNIVASRNLSLSAGLIGSVQSLSGAGAVNVTTLTTAVTTTSADALTLADGVSGQIKHIVMVVDGGDGTLTPTNFGNGSTITFADVGDAVTLQFLASNWWVVGSHGSPAIA